MRLLVKKPSEANFYAATRTNLGYGTYGYAPANTLGKAKNKYAVAAGKIGSFLGKNKMKAGLAGVGLVGAGALASKALNRPKSLESRIKKTLKKNPPLSMASKMFR